VQPSADFQVELADGVLDRKGAADRPRRSVESGEEAVAGGVHLLSAEAAQLRADALVMLLQQPPPGAVAQLSRPRGRVDNVGEKNCREDSVRLHLPRLALDDLVQEALQLSEEPVRVPELRREVAPR